MRVALVGLPSSGKSSLFAAVAELGGSHVHVERADQEHLAVVKVSDERVEWLEKLHAPKKRVHAELEFLDVPGLDLSSEAARQRARSHWPAVRQSAMILLVLRNFRNDAVAPYRDRVGIQADLSELMSEMLFSDLDQVMARIDKLQAAVKKPIAASQREQQEHELALFQRLQRALEAEQPLAAAIHNPNEEKIVRAFAFLTLKPVLVAVNCDEGAVPKDAPGRLGHYEAVYLSARLEEELARLEESERGEFMRELGVEAAARDRLVGACYRTLKLVSFLTCGDKEVRAWTVPAGTDALAAAGEIHSDMARGFIRAEVVAFEDLKAAGSEKAAKAAGKYRLEGKSYLIQDGDVILFRFNV